MNSALARILDYFQTHPAPTMRELVRAGLASSTSTARARCERLVALGLLAEAEPGTARRYRLAASPLHTAARLLIERAEVRGGDVVIPRAAYEAVKELV